MNSIPKISTDTANEIINNLVDASIPVFGKLNKNLNDFGLEIDYLKNHQPYDVKETDNNVKIIVKMPGCNKDDISAFIQNDKIHISGMTAIKLNDFNEFDEISYNYSINVRNIDSNNDNIKTTYKNGILKILINKLVNKKLNITIE